MLKNPITTLAHHSELVSGVVLANVPKNSMMMIWNTAVHPRTATNTQLFNIPLKTSIFSMFRELISLNTCGGKIANHFFFCYAVEQAKHQNSNI